MVIRVLDHVSQCYTAADGAIIAAIVRSRLAAGQEVCLSFDGVTNVPSSFANAAFGGLAALHPSADIRALLRTVHSSRQINDAIRRRIAPEVAEMHAA